MRLNRLAVTIAFSSLVMMTVFAAGEGCSSTDAHPDAGNTDIEGGGPIDAPTSDGQSVFEGGPGDADSDSGNNGCNNHFKDNEETDVDCGGSVCQKCVDGKACVKPSDCAGNSCINLVCKTSSCANGVLDGDETDVDCGGKTCPACNIGKHCSAPTDCGSNTCTNTLCKCPATMVEVAKQTGNSSYCIDETEVTKGQYYKFLTASVPVTSQVDICQSNTTFVPRAAWPPSTMEDLAPNRQGLQFSFSIPVHYVDWCDAYAYCKWSGKQLCGEINKQGLDPSQRNDAGASAWYNACSAQGTKGWPYGTSYNAVACNGNGVGSLGTNTAGANPDGGSNDPTYNCCDTMGTGACVTAALPYVDRQCTFGIPGGIYQDDGVYVVAQSDNMGNFMTVAHQGCQGGSVGLFHMSGNLAEWEDTCTDGGAEAGASQSCAVRGGSYQANDDQTKLRCDAIRDEMRLPPAGTPDPLADVGIRCCVY